LIGQVSEYYGKAVNGEMTVDFVEPNYPASQSEQLTIDQQSIDMGLTKPTDIMMRNNPDLTEEDAKADVAINLNARNDMLNKITSVAITTDIDQKL